MKAWPDTVSCSACGPLPWKSALNTPVSNALIAHRVGDYAGAAKLLQDVRESIVTMGGSNDQQDLFELILSDAEERA